MISEKPTLVASVQTDYLASWGAIALYTLAFILLALSIATVYHPNTQPALDFAARESILIMSEFRPEPLEKDLFVLAAFTAPFLMLAFYRMLRGALQDCPAQTLHALYRVFSLGLALVLAALAVRAFFWPAPNFAFPLKDYFGQTFAYQHPKTYLLGAYPALLFFLFYALPRFSTKVQRIGSGLLWLWVALLTVLIFLLPIFTPASVNSGTTYAFHFNAIFASQAQACAGQPLLVDGFRNTYGLYPMFLVPLFALMGGLTLVKFTALMAALLVLTFACYFGFLRLLLQSRFVLFLGITLITYCAIFLQFTPAEPDPYFQVYPLRTIFPSLILLLGALYILKDIKHLYYPIFILCVMASLWNLETGIITAASWWCLLVYREIATGLWKQAARNTILHSIKFGITFALVVVAYSLTIRLFYGQYPDYRLYLSTYAIYTNGYVMLPLPLLHPWNFFAIAYAWGLLYGVRALLNKTATPRTALIVFLSILGVGSFVMYQGRSHDVCLWSPLKEVLLLLAIFADDAWTAFLRQRGSNKRVPHTVIFLTLSSLLFCVGVLGTVGSLPTLLANIKKNLIDTPKTTKVGVPRNLRFLREHTKPGEEILIISENQGVYYAETQTRAAYATGFTDMFYFKESDAFLKILREKRVKIFFEPGTCAFFYSRVNFKEEVEKELKAGHLKEIAENESFHLLVIP